MCFKRIIFRIELLNCVSMNMATRFKSLTLAQNISYIVFGYLPVSPKFVLPADRCMVMYLSTKLIR